MLQTTMARPSAVLRPYVWAYGTIFGAVLSEPLRIPLPARPKQLLTFSFGDPYRILDPESHEEHASPRVTVAGPQTYARAGLSAFGTIDTFTIHFQPAGFYRLFGIPMTELTDAAYDAYGVIGARLPGMEDELACAPSFAKRVELAERCLMGMLDSDAAPDPIAFAANRLFRRAGLQGVSAMAAEVNLSPRQFERRFLAQVGIPPKLYARIIRFNAALDNKLRSPGYSWTRVANEHEYYDQMHLLRDCRAFTGEPPERFLARLAPLPAFHAFYATEPVRIA
ncbi:MAG TPA: helix-turn-helix domain-containing protein [Terracidiphilus sp.]|nr:helix-turn-helix domain-containing protein [Terracidiphilus sp.]